MNDQVVTGYSPQRSTMVIWSIVLLLLVYVGRINEVIPGMGAFPIAKVFYGLCAISFLTSSQRNSMSEYLRMPVFRKVLLLIFLAAVSTLFSIWKGGSLEALTHLIFNNLLFMVVLIVVVGKEDLPMIGWGVAWSLLSLEIGAFLNRGEMEEEGRVGVGSFDPNDLAFMLVSFLPLVYFLWKREKGVPKMLLGIIIAFNLLVIVYTKSRGGVVGLAAIVALICYLETRSIVKALALIFVSALLFLFLSPSSLLERFAPHEEEVVDYNASIQKGGVSSGRTEIWKRGVSLMVDNPLLGTGPGTFELAEGRLHTDEATGLSGKWSSAHNSFVQIGSDMGILALIIFILMIKDVIVALKSPAHRGNDDDQAVPESLAWLANGTLVGIVGYSVSGFFLSQAYSSVLYILIGLAMLYGYHREDPAGDSFATFGKHY